MDTDMRSSKRRTRPSLDYKRCSYLTTLQELLRDIHSFATKVLSNILAQHIICRARRNASVEMVFQQEMHSCIEESAVLQDSPDGTPMHEERIGHLTPYVWQLKSEDRLSRIVLAEQLADFTGGH